MSQQHQIVQTQLQQVQQQLAEAKVSLDELKKIEEGTAVYRSVGGLMVQVKDLDALKEDLGERAEELEVKESSYSKHEKSLRENLDELKEELNLAISQGGSPPDIT